MGCSLLKPGKLALDNLIIKQCVLIGYSFALVTLFKNSLALASYFSFRTIYSRPNTYLLFNSYKQKSDAFVCIENGILNSIHGLL